MEGSFSTDPNRLSDIRRYVRERADEASLAREVSADVVLAVSEVCSNVLVHTDSDSIEVRLRIETGRIDVEARANGVYRPPFPDLFLRRGSGGLPMILSLIDEVSITTGTETDPETVVRLTKYQR